MVVIRIGFLAGVSKFSPLKINMLGKITKDHRSMKFVKQDADDFKKCSDIPLFT
jgi:hypothetical protein